MGLLGGTKIYVSSVAYNLAGDEKDRPNFLKSVVIGNILTPRNISMSQALASAYGKGPGMKLRSLFKWAQRNYKLVGMPQSRGRSSFRIDYNAVKQRIPVEWSTIADIRVVKTGVADYTWWAEQWILDYEPAIFETNWQADIDNNYNEITIYRADGTSITFAPQGFDRNALYLYVVYGSRNLHQGRIWIYKYLSGQPTLDIMISETAAPLSDWYPVIPVRLNNRFVSEENRAELYYDAKRCYKKATGEHLDSLIDKLKDNENLDDIDYAHVIFGVSLNTKENAGLRYLYQFFFKHMPNQATDSQYYQLWKSKQELYEQQAQAWVDWRDEQGFVRPGDLLQGTKQPSYPRPPVPPWNGVQIRHEAPADIDFDIDIGWRAITEQKGTGLGKPDAKPGDLWWEVRSGYRFNLFGQDGQVITKKSSQKDDYVVLWWQTGVDSWRALHIEGLVHNNFVYRGKDVETTATEAITDEDPSGFIVPLQYSTFTEMSLIEATQMSTACIHLVLNSYKVVKKKWYQTGLFKIVLIVAVIATIYFTGGFSAGAVGALGSNLAVGTAIGLTGMAAIIVGAVANAIAAMIITSVITKGATAAFGAKIGAIVGVLASLVAINGLTNMASTGNFAINFGSMARAENLLKLASAAGNAYSGFVEASIADIAAETQEMLDEYKGEAEKLSALYEEMVGSDRGVIDPTTFTNVGSPFIESPGSFLGRTLMTGSDIADLSLEMLSNFADITLSTELSLDA
jgi:hypothetical protein